MGIQEGSSKTRIKRRLKNVLIRDSTLGILILAIESFSIS